MTPPNPVADKTGKLPIVGPASLGVLSIHLDGAPCRVGCEFCYLGARSRPFGPVGPSGPGSLSPAELEAVLARLDFAEVAVALSEPALTWLPQLEAIVAAAGRRRRPVAVTTTFAVLADLVRQCEVSGRDPLAGVSRVSLSVDPRKGPTRPLQVSAAAAAARAPGREVVLIVSLIDARFAGWLLDGGLGELLELPAVDKVALSALKPPPPWCDRSFWLRALARLAPLLERHLDRRLFLDCYLAARILGLGDCPARPDLSPGGQFRACVYQPAPDFLYATPDELAARLRGFCAPARCPFPID